MQKRVWVIWLAAFGILMLLGLLFSVNDYLFQEMLARYYRGPLSLPSMLFWDLVYWPTWALIAPLILLLARRFPFGRNRWHLILLLLAGFPLVILQRIIYASIVWLLQPADGSQISFREILPYNLPLGFMIYAVILLVISLIEVRASHLKAETTRAELQVLKGQLRPHILFNTLNSISTLLHEDVKAADEMVAQLGDFLRLTLDNSGAQIVTLKEELELLRRYLAIEQLRLEDRLQVSYDIEPQTLGARVPNLILQPVVENAVKHGVGQSFGRVRIVVSARRENSRLCLQIKDDGERGPRADAGYTEGFGLTNTRSRLNSAYDSDCRFELRRTTDGWTTATLEMPFHALAENAAISD